MKLGLGTVQFGLDYGISNSAGRTLPAEVREILSLAASKGLLVLDTAAGYGRSEEVLGECSDLTRLFRIVTKTPAFGGGSTGGSNCDRLGATFRESLRRLRRQQVYGLLAHQADDLLAPGGERLVEAMLDLKARGLVEKVGASVYNGAQIDALVGRFPIDIVQLPLSVLDQRLLASGHIGALKRAGVEIHVRSIFLQGLLLMPLERLPEYFEPARAHLRRYLAFLQSRGMTPMQAALGFALGVPEVDHVILGVNTRQQLHEILSQEPAPVDVEWREFALDMAPMVDPSQWRLN